MLIVSRITRSLIKLHLSLIYLLMPHEFGYIRPDWITLERGGMSAFSHFPNNPELIREIASKCENPDLKQKYPYTKGQEILFEVSYNLISYFTGFLYPFYRSDRYYNPLVEYISGIPGLFTETRRHRKARLLVNRLIRKKRSIFLFSMQLQNDYQLRSNAPFSHQKDAIELTISSFARYAEDNTDLIFKAHPLDTGLERWKPFIQKKAEEYGVSERVHFVTGGKLLFMLKRSKGCVLINSTVGLHAVRNLCPVKVLGHAIYDMKGLTHQGELDGFWKAPQKPDEGVVEDFVKAVASTIQIKGNFFTPAGQTVASQEFSQKVIDNEVNGLGAYVAIPPRLATLRAIEPPLWFEKNESENTEIGMSVDPNEAVAEAF